MMPWRNWTELLIEATFCVQICRESLHSADSFGLYVTKLYIQYNNVEAIVYRYLCDFMWGSSQEQTCSMGVHLLLLLSVYV